MQRSESTQFRPIFLLIDYPIKCEVDANLAWSAPSSMEYISDLASVGIKQTINLGDKDNVLLKYNLWTSYLSYNRPAPDDFDFSTSVLRKTTLHKLEKENLISLNDYTEIPFEQNIFCHKNLWAEILSLVQEIKNKKPKFLLVAGKWSLYFLSGRIPFGKTQGTKKDKKPLGALATHRTSITRPWAGWELPDDLIIYPILPTTEKWRSLNDKRVKTEKAYLTMRWDMQKFAEIFKLTEEGSLNNRLFNNKRIYQYGTSIDIIENFFQRLEHYIHSVEIPSIAVDIETRFNSIDCIGISYDNYEGLCIPFSTIDNPTPWTLEDELTIIRQLRPLLCHTKVVVTGQNFSYDSQYIHKFFGWDLYAKRDTMIAQHCLYNTLKKDLATLASYNCLNYSYWKDAQDHSMEEIAK